MSFLQAGGCVSAGDPPPVWMDPALPSCDHCSHKVLCREVWTPTALRVVPRGILSAGRSHTSSSISGTPVKLLPHGVTRLNTTSLWSSLSINLNKEHE